LHSAARGIKLAGLSCSREVRNRFKIQLNPWETIMKAGIHPEYREVVFQDMSSDFAFLTRSTIDSKETVK